MTSFTEWMGEPESPLTEVKEDVWFFVDGSNRTQNAYDTDFCSLTKGEVAQQLLEYVENLVETEDNKTFPNRFEEKVDFPIFNEIQSLLPTEEIKFSDIDVELQELDNDLSFADLTLPDSSKDIHSDTLLLDLDLEAGRPSNPNIIEFSFYPGQSADKHALNCLAASKNFIQNTLFEEHTRSSLMPSKLISESDLQVPDIEKELAIVDEIVRTTAENLENRLDPWETETSSSQSSSSSSVNSFGSPRSLTYESDDPEWMPMAEKTICKSQRSSRRSKPYRTQEDRKLRKKEQNKNAATRYRQKKKAEVSEILEKEKALEEKKGKLQRQVSDIKLEIKCLKRLMKDLFKAKGLLNN